MSLPAIHEIESLLREVAAAELLPRFNRVGHDVKADGSLLTEADLAVDRALHEALTARWPEIGFLSEEMPKAEQEALLAETGRPLWVLDPVDGTSNFVAGIPYFAISLALVADGRPVLGVTLDPVRDECFSAALGQGAFLNGEPLRCRAPDIDLEHAVALVDFKRLAPPLKTRLMAASPFGSQRNFGSCALEWCWIAAGRGHVYLHGGMKLWDIAPGSLILGEAGGLSSTLDGETVFVPRMEARSVIMAPAPALFDAWSGWLRQA